MDDSSSIAGGAPRPRGRRLVDRPRFERWLPYFLFAVATIAFAPTAATGRATLAPFDIVEHAAPYRDGLGRDPHVISPVQGDQIEWTPNVVVMWRDLVHLRWNSFSPQVGGGQPTGALPVFGIYSVFNVGFAVLPPWLAMNVRIFALLLVTQIGCYLFSRRLGFGMASATFIALVYTFNGSSLAVLNRLVAATLVPWLLLAVIAALRRPTIGRLLAVSGVVAALWFEGYVPAFVYSMTIGAVFLVCTVMWDLVVGRGHYQLRGALVRVGAIGLAVAMGLGIAAFCVFTFVGDVSSSGNLESRVYDSTSHLPKAQFWGMLDESTFGDPLDAPSATGQNPVEGLDQMGTVALVVAAAGLIGLVIGKVGVDPRLRLPIVMSLTAAPAVMYLMYFGSPLLAAFYKIPVLGESPASRLRFLAAWGLAMIGGAAIEAALRRAPAVAAGLRIRVIAALSGAAILAMAVASFGEFRHVILHAGGFGLVAGRAFDGVLLVGFALAIVAVVRWEPPAESVTALVLGAVVLVDLVVPMRDFQAQVPHTLDSFRTTALHRELHSLAGHRYRVAASDGNLPWNASLLYDELDLRGHGLYSQRYKRFVAGASPGAFVRDPLKMIVTREEWNPASPIWDEMSLRYLVLASAEQPFGAERVVDDAAERWLTLHAGDNDVPLTATEAMPIGVGLRLRESGSCRGGARVTVAISDSAGATRHVTRALAAKASASNLEWFALTGDRLAVTGQTLRIHMPKEPSCVTEVAVDTTGRAAHHLAVDDPSDGVALIDNVDAQLYERSSARPLVEASTQWTATTGIDDAVARLRNRRAGDESLPMAVLHDGDQPDRDTGSRAPAESSGALVDGAEISTTVSSGSRALVVAHQDDRPGFVAYVDGREQRIVEVNGFQLGVIVPAGRHRVLFRYEPTSLTLGLWISLCSLLTCGALLLVARRRQPVVALCERLDGAAR